MGTKKKKNATTLLTSGDVSAAGKTRTKDKYRVVYTDHQRLELEKEFHYSRYITIRRKSELASVLGLSERQVTSTFFCFFLIFADNGQHPSGYGRSRAAVPSDLFGYEDNLSR